MKTDTSSRIYVIGNVNIDLLMGPLDHWPQKGTEATLPECDWRPGGSAGNTALALQAIGADCRIIANRGKDRFGDWLADHFQWSAGWPSSQSTTSVTVGVTHSDHERTFLTGRGNVETMTLADVLGQLPEQTQGGEIALLSGAFLTLSLLDDYTNLLMKLKQRGMRVALDTGWPPQGWADSLSYYQQWLPLLDYLLLNELEISSLGTLLALQDVVPVSQHEHEPLNRACAVITRHMHEHACIVIKQGAAGASCWTREKFEQVTAPVIDINDTIGAGDIFNAGFLYGQAQQMSIAQSLQSGITLASHTIASKPRQFMSAATFHALTATGA